MKKNLSSLDTEMPEGFIDIQKIIPNITIELLYLGSKNFVGKPINGYEKNRGILTKKAAQALAHVQKELQTMSLGILLYDAYRPTQAVEDFIAWINDPNDTTTKEKYYPNIEKQDIITQGYLSPVSSHSRGSTVDITLISLPTKNNTSNNYELIDMGSSFDFFGKQSHSDYMDITPQQRANRLLLQTIMKKYDFIPLKEEWWHFTLANEPFPDTYFNFPIK